MIETAIENNLERIRSDVAGRGLTFGRLLDDMLDHVCCMVEERMHWPGAGSVILLSAGFLIIGFIPLYVVNAFQRAGREKVTLPYVVMLLVGIALSEYVAISHLLEE